MTEPTARLLSQLDRHEPRDGVEARSVERIRALVRWLPHPFDEAADPTHVTASAIVADGEGHVVLHLHRRLRKWLQPGGHVDPGERPEDAVLREVLEETGLVGEHHREPPDLLHVDVHDGGRGHVHLDLRYLLLVPAGAPLRPAPGESREVAWLPYEEVPQRADTSTVAAVRAARQLLEDAG